jgi:SAM-dependent methyltransferase
VRAGARRPIGGYAADVRVGIVPDGPLDRVALAAGLVPRPVFEGFVAFATARTIMAGTSLGVFAALAEQPDDAAGLASRLGITAAGADVLLAALASIGYLDERDGRFHVTSVVRRHLLPGPRSVEEWTGSFSYDMWEVFGRLEDVLRGGSAQRIHAKAPDDPYWERYMRGLAQLARLGAPAVARLLALRDPHTVLDIAGGHGTYSVALCRRHPGLHATVVELEGAAVHGRRLVAEAGLADRVRFEVGDAFSADLGRGHDAAMVNNLLHHLDAEASVELLRRAREALRPGGTMAVLEFERPAAGERGDAVGALTGLLFHVASGARTWSARELAGFFARAGFTGVRARWHPELPGSVLLLGRAP